MSDVSAVLTQVATILLALAGLAFVGYGLAIVGVLMVSWLKWRRRK